MAKKCVSCGTKIGFLDEDYPVPDGVECYSCHKGSEVDDKEMVPQLTSSPNPSFSIASSPVESSLLFGIGWLGIAVSVVGALIVIGGAKYSAEKWAAVASGFTGVVGSLVLLALARILTLLQEIRDDRRGHYSDPAS